MQGTIPDSLEPVEVSTGKPKEAESGYVDLVGQISLQTLEKNERKKRHTQGPNRPPNQRPPHNNPPSNNSNNRGGGGARRRDGRK